MSEGIEVILRRKAEERRRVVEATQATEQAERVKAEREDMDQRRADEVRIDAAARGHARSGGRTASAEKRIAQEQEYERLQGSIVALDEKIIEVRELLHTLEESHGQVGAVVADIKAEKARLTEASSALQAMFDEPSFQEILADEGILTVADLLDESKGAAYADDSKIMAVKGGLESLPRKKKELAEKARTRLAARRRSQKVLNEEGVTKISNLVYADMVNVLTNLIPELEAKRKELYFQTPEGESGLQHEKEKEQEARKAEVLTGVVERRKNPGGGFYAEVPTVESTRRIHDQMTYRLGDEEDAKKYGDEAVKSAIKEYYHGAVDTALSEEARGSGQAQFSEDIRTLDALPAQWHEVRTKLSAVKQMRQEVVSSITAMGEQDTTLLEDMRSFGNYSKTASAEGLASALVTHFASYPAFAFNMLEADSLATPEKQIEDLCGAEEDGIVRTIRVGGALGRLKPKNPDRALRILESLEAVYTIVRGLSPEDLKTFLTDRAGKSGVTNSINVVVPRDIMSIPRELSFGSFTVGQSGQTLSRLRHEVVDFEKKQKERASELKSQIDAKVELDWSVQELDAFLREAPNTRWTNYGLVEQVRKIKELQVAGENLLRSADALVGRGAPLQEMMEAEIVVNHRGEVHFVGHDLSKCAKDSEALLSQIRPINKEITAIRERAGREGNGLFGGKKRAREQEIAVLQLELEPLDRQFATVEAAFTLAKAQDAKLEKMREWMRTTRAAGFEIYPNDSTQTRTVAQTVADFKECIAKVQPTKEEEEIFARYETLQEKADSAKQTYDKKWPGRRSY